LSRRSAAFAGVSHALRQQPQPRYIVDLLKRIVRVSLETMKIVNVLPPLNEPE